MPIQFKEESNGKILIVHVSGKLVKEDYARFVPEFERLVKLNGKLRLLFDMAGFKGWDAGAAWEDFKFGVEHFSEIERLAMAGDKLWEKGMAVFCRPFTKASIKYFDYADIAQARKWLKET
jgi:hypothetical protein